VRATRRYSPISRPRRAAFSIAAILLLTILILLVVAVIVFWPDIEPIVRDVTGGNEGGR
jgi:predicted PurR-regulated permease PerM